jgi:hypothetical protein
MKPVAKKFVPESCFLLLPVETLEIPDRIRAEAQARDMIQKEECHISIAVTKNAMKIAGAVSINTNPQEALKAVASLFERFAWEYSLTEEYYLQENFYDESGLAAQGYPKESPEHTRRTIVQIVDLSDLLDFYKKLSDLLDVTLPVPVPHITLFSWSDNSSFATRGIGISSKEEFEAYSLGKL